MGPRGFTLTEILVALAVLTILVGSLTPVAIHQIGRAREARALEEIGALAEAVHSFRQDVKSFPDRKGGKPQKLGYLLTDGKKPKGLGSWSGPSGSIAQHLIENNPAGKDYETSGLAAWRGPYIAKDPADPWGRAYVLAVSGFRNQVGARGWILSAGPNGVLETDDGDTEIAASSDDLGWRLR
ncbi:MAG: prepilin-type N-terminal cleavage/methylation domain-containing protein [bacterium]|nr:prepilin-type N-terminal cleavage/methylation domain-containing protein [bacterium]